ncbi:hypothetical protein SMD44_07817 [Streptomyces alboflavus]|uniref:Uncharacterized protein n=1 Tax=Streptomyces alboflavus TaxID=67267 RepID=A0A1Z1WPK8_9ACTN|nr:hypothetical protein SMD44_07817 [Streptomyces alboflavus]
MSALALACAVSGCGTVDGRREAARAAVARFEQAVRTGDAAALCGALAPGTREELEQSGQATCAAAVLGEDLPHGGAGRHVDVHGRQARVVLEKDTVFLSQFPDGWKVVAAGCLPQGDRPYRCSVKGS